MAAIPEYEVYAVRYATRAAPRRSYFIGGDPHEAETSMDYYVWLVRHESASFVVDTGFGPEVAAQRGRTFLRHPSECFAMLGVDVATVRDVIVTHMHYDHIGTFDRFPLARFHLQDDEMAYATGRHMCHGQFNHGYEIDEVVGMVRLVYQARVRFHRGEAELAPGVSIHRIGGHTHGLQCVRVHTRRGWVVLASDCSHFYEHFENDRVFTTMFNVGEAIQGYRRLRELADSDKHVVPGHDPLVMQRYPAASAALQGIAVRLDAQPLY
ncbi:MAG: N-acyl homoserine lactonase family protein [Burkholderiales bacterium]|nr:N-acyl homoserine lactonase family protein [Burkholderiales bacterium]ODU66321.1 MAG: MBL fold hydrolase [Lautropia sp. SCN 66-9]